MRLGSWFDRLYRWFASLFIPRPSIVRFTLVSRKNSMILLVKPILPAPTKPNIVTQVLTYATTPFGATDPHPSVTIEIDVTKEVPTLEFGDGDSVTASVHQIDAKGLVSPESDVSTTVVVDTIVPPKPGVVGFVVVDVKPVVVPVVPAV